MGRPSLTFPTPCTKARTIKSEDFNQAKRRRIRFDSIRFDSLSRVRSIVKMVWNSKSKRKNDPPSLPACLGANRTNTKIRWQRRPTRSTLRRCLTAHIYTHTHTHTHTRTYTYIHALYKPFEEGYEWLTYNTQVYACGVRPCRQLGIRGKERTGGMSSSVFCGRP